ncbi:MAG: hypothetical protein WD058_03660 [Dehalococcoidia bacterium]
MDAHLTAAPSDRGRAIEVAVAAAVVVALAALVALAWADEGDDGVGGVLRFFEDGRGVQVVGLALLAGFILSTGALVGSWAGAGASRTLSVAGVVLVRVLLLAAVIFMFAFPDLSQFEAKSLTWRTIVYPSIAAIVPVTYALRGRQGPYPLLFDMSLVFGVTFDIVSNDLHWYGTWTWFDDFLHVTNSIPLMVVVGLLVLALERRGRLVRGFWGAVLFAYLAYFAVHGLWEVQEYLLDEYLGTELQPGGMAEATTNNIGGLAGAALGVALLWYWRRRGRLDAAGVTPVAALFGSRPGEA